MATVIDADFTLADDKVLIFPDEDGGGSPICTGVVERLAATITGPQSYLTSLIVEIFDNPPESSPRTVIGHKHAYVVFNLEAVQEVEIDSENYFIADSSQVLGILPIPYDERLL